jgi:hypothetical protein
MVSFLMGALDSIVIPVVALNAAAMATIAAIAFGTGGRPRHDSPTTGVDTSAAIEAMVEKEIADAAVATTATSTEPVGSTTDVSSSSDKSSDTPPFPIFYVTMSPDDDTCVAFGEGDASARKGALYVKKAIQAADEETSHASSMLMRRAALDLAYAAADSVRRNCAGSYVPLHPKPGAWLSQADIEVETVFGVTLHVYCRLVGLVEAVDGSSKGPSLSVTIDASAPSCIDPARAEGTARDALTRFAATCAARLLATVAGDEHDGSVMDATAPAVHSDHAALYRLEKTHEVRRIARLVGVPDGGGAEVVIARAAVRTLAALRSMKHMAVLSLNKTDTAAFVPLPPGRPLAESSEADLDASLAAAIAALDGTVGPAVTSRLIERDRRPRLVVPLQRDHPWAAGFVARSSDSPPPGWIKYDALAKAWTGGPAESPLSGPKKMGPSIRDHFDDDPKMVGGRGPDTIDDPTATVYVLGDLEGCDNVLTAFLASKKLIKVETDARKHTVITWTGANNTYVVQCGDQIDSDRSEAPQTPQFDCHVLLLTDYLARVSDGRFRSIIGNHEWMNVTKNMKYVHADHARLDRASLFDYDGMCAAVLRRRHLLLRVNNVLFSHAGWPETPPGLQAEHTIDPGATAPLDTFLKRANDELNDRNNYGSDDALYSSTFNALHHEKSGILWNRCFFESSPENHTYYSTAAVPAFMRPAIRAQVIGHNKVDKGGAEMMYNVHSLSVPYDAASACKTKGTPSSCSYQNVTVSKDMVGVVMTDVASRQRSIGEFRYLAITWSASVDPVFNFGTYECTGDTCPIVSFDGLLGKTAVFNTTAENDLWIGDDEKNAAFAALTKARAAVSDAPSPDASTVDAMKAIVRDMLLKRGAFDARDRLEATDTTAHAIATAALDAVDALITCISAFSGEFKKAVKTKDAVIRMVARIVKSGDVWAMISDVANVVINRGIDQNVVITKAPPPAAAPTTQGSTPGSTPLGSTPLGSTPGSTPLGSTPLGSTPLVTLFDL